MHFVSENSYNQIDIAAKMSCGEIRFSDFAVNTSIFNHNNCRSFISSDKSKVFEIDIGHFKAIKLSLKSTRSESDTVRSVIYRIIYLSFHTC